MILSSHYFICSRLSYTVWCRMMGGTCVQQRVQITWLSETGMTTTQRTHLFEHICPLLNFQNKPASNCTGLRHKDFCVLGFMSSQGWAEPQFHQNPVPADGSIHTKFLWTTLEVEMCLTWALPHAWLRWCDSVPGIKVSDSLYQSQLTGESSKACHGSAILREGWMPQCEPV